MVSSLNPPASTRPILNQSFGFRRIVFHAYPPDQFLRGDRSDCRRKSRRAPRNRSVETLAAVCRRIFLGHVFGVLIVVGDFFEPRPHMHHRKVITRLFAPRRLLHGLANLPGDFGRRARARPTVKMIPNGIPRADHRDFDAVSILHPERFPGAGFIRIVLENQDRQSPSVWRAKTS